MDPIDRDPAHWLEIDRRFAAPVALVWRLWTDADLLRRWFGPKDFTCPSYSLDLRPGGRYRGLIRADRYGDSWFGGEFLDIVPCEKLIMSFAWERGSGLTDPTGIALTFSEEDGFTRQRFRQGPFSELAERDSHLSGWSECIDKEKVFLVTRKEGSS